MSAPARLRVEHLDNAVLGLGDRRPRLSWSLPDGASHQLAYCVEVNGRALDRIEARDSVLVPWPDEPLTSRSRIEWRVKVWTDLGESEWSAPASFETGLLDAADWVAEWIEPHEPVRADAGRAPGVPAAAAVRARLGRPDARLYATAHGVTRPSSTASGSAISSSRRASRATNPASTSRPTTSPTSSSPARTPGAWS